MACTGDFQAAARPISQDIPNTTEICKPQLQNKKLQWGTNILKMYSTNKITSHGSGKSACGAMLSTGMHSA